MIVLSAVRNDILYLYLDERRGVQENTSMRSSEFLRAALEGTLETECWYFPVLPDPSQVHALGNLLWKIHSGSEKN